MIRHDLERAPDCLRVTGDGCPSPMEFGRCGATAGKSNAQIGMILGMMPRKVAKHLERIDEKLGVGSRTAAAMRARLRDASRSWGEPT